MVAISSCDLSEEEVLGLNKSYGFLVILQDILVAVLAAILSAILDLPI